ncbi:glycosyltransferase [Paenibacillus hexagrammi]|uniref:Glycosyltransferase n=1 Tax=Paenibacillus hexagrammi TaxID=2908839 RepID=A0ABY3SI34_9BACL|nr:glycosyltransferase [Paenibacillus sp. YPD9-1]UJF32785.1 glycosyltransferase [Paenibacillus sp. YPD9-1]
MFLGRLSNVKGLDLILHSIATLRQEGIVLYLALVGSGEQEQALRQLCSRLSLESQIFFIGQKESTELPEILACGDFAMFASHTEGFPLALLECMASGLPVVTTRAGDIANVVVNGCNGLILDNRTITSYAAACKHMMNRFPMMAGEAVRTANMYSQQAMFNKFADILYTICR